MLDDFIKIRAFIFFITIVTSSLLPPEVSLAVSPQVAAGVDNTFGLKSDGTVVAVGYSYDGQLNVGSWTGIQQVAAGDYHTVGLKSDGTVEAVGWNSDGQLNVESWTGIQQVAAGYDHTVGLKADGTVVAVGYNKDGQLNVEDFDLGGSDKICPPKKIANLQSVYLLLLGQ